MGDGCDVVVVVLYDSLRAVPVVAVAVVAAEQARNRTYLQFESASHVKIHSVSEGL